MNQILEWSSIISAKATIFKYLTYEVGSAILVETAKNLIIVDCFFIKCTAKSTTKVASRVASGGAILAFALIGSFERVCFNQCTGKEYGSSMIVSGINGNDTMIRQLSASLVDGISGIFTDNISPFISDVNCTSERIPKTSYLLGIGGSPECLSLKFYLGSSNIEEETFISISGPTDECKIDSLVALNFQKASPLFNTNWRRVTFQNINVVNCSGYLFLSTLSGSILFEDSFLGSNVIESEGLLTGDNVTFRDGQNILAGYDYRLPYITKCLKFSNKELKAKSLWNSIFWLIFVIDIHHSSFIQIKEI